MNNKVKLRIYKRHLYRWWQRTIKSKSGVFLFRTYYLFKAEYLFNHNITNLPPVGHKTRYIRLRELFEDVREQMKNWIPHVALPNPGSVGAQFYDCTCPVMDNRRGKGIGYDEFGRQLFIISADCPIHGEKANASKRHNHRHDK